MTNPEAAPQRDDLATVAALAAIAYVLSMLAHEALGHGGACLAAGGRVTALWALDLRCDLGGFPTPERAWRIRFVAAAGPLMPLLIGLPILIRGGWMRTVLGSADSAPSPSRTLFAWLLGALLVLPSVGYFCLAPARAGDWGIALAGVDGALRLGIAAAGVVLYAAATRALVRQLGAALPVWSGDAVARARRIAWTGYAVANLLAAGAAARQLGAASTMALSGWSGALASLAGTSGLLWGVLGMRAKHPPRPPLRPVELRWGVVAAGVAAAVVFVALLGRGVRFGS